jgi:hypothetical protein
MSRARTFADLATASEEGNLATANIVINGDMAIWQRGTTSITASGPNYFCDRFATDHGQGGATTSQLTLSGSDTPYTLGFRYGLRMTNTSNTTATNGYRQLRYRAEAQDIANSGWNYTDPNSFITLSFWVKSSLAGTYYCTLEPDDQSDKYAYNIGFTLLADTWTKVTHAVPGHSTLVFNNDNGIGMSIHWRIWLGTNYTTSGTGTSSWYDTDSSSTLSPDFLQNWANTSSATFDLTGFQMELGEVATPFKHESYGDNLQRCQRYFYKYISNNDYGPLGANGMQINTNSSSGVMYQGQHPITMRAAPTMAYGGSWNAEVATGNGSFSLAGSVRSSDLFWQSQEAIGDGGANGYAAIVYASGDDDAFLSGDAEL